jgi:hypothetical protein
MVWWIVIIVAVLLVAAWVVSRRRSGKERYRPDQAAINLAKKKDMGRW